MNNVSVRTSAFAVFYAVVILFFTPWVTGWLYRAIFWCYSGFLLWMSYSIPQKQAQLYTPRSQRWFLIIIFCLLVGIRVTPFIHWGEAPLGYDTGIYLRQFQRYLIDPVESMRPLAVLVRILSASGFSLPWILHGFLIVINILVGLAIYGVASTVFRSRLIATSALFIFAISVGQYEAYIWMFYRMMLGLLLTLLALRLLMRRSVFAALVGAYAGSIHPATFLLFGSSYVLFLFVLALRFRIRNYWSSLGYYFVVGWSMLAGAVVLNISEYAGEIHYLTQQRLQLAGWNPYLSSELTGHYLNSTAFGMSTLFYIPFALLGIHWLVRQHRKWKSIRREEDLLFIFSFSFVALFFVFNRFIFYGRYLIIIDVLMILFAGVWMAQMITYFQQIPSGRAFLLTGMIGLSLVAAYYAATRDPWIPPSELQELKQAANSMESGSMAMATDAYYTPWVYGYLSSQTIAPGYFMDRWNIEQWGQFWNTGTDENRRQLLSIYGHLPLYIFVGEHQAKNPRMVEFLNAHARKISPHLWRYLNGSGE